MPSNNGSRVQACLRNFATSQQLNRPKIRTRRTRSNEEGYEGRGEDRAGSVAPTSEKKKQKLVVHTGSAPRFLTLGPALGGDDRVFGCEHHTTRRKVARSSVPAGRQGGGGTATGHLLASSKKAPTDKMEASINMRVFKAFLLVFILLIIDVKANPLPNYSRDREPALDYNNNNTPNADSQREPQIDHYDQRQNGTENYRVKVDGLVFILAPADSLLLAGAALEPNFTSLFSESNKPKPKPEKDFDKLKDDKDDILKTVQQENAHVPHKPVLRISNLLAPFLNRISAITKTDKVQLHKNLEVSR